ncbi:hypothetical protein P7C70_g1044, partial [Phenoliferia sp. Uapishka_3]
MIRSPRALLGTLSLLLISTILLLFTLDPLPNTSYSISSNPHLQSALDNLRGWGWSSTGEAEGWSDAELESIAREKETQGNKYDQDQALAKVKASTEDFEKEQVVSNKVQEFPPKEEENVVEENNKNVEDDADPATPISSTKTIPTEIKPCERTLLFRFGGTRGFASEYNRFIRVAAVADAFEYEVIPVATDWMYGDHLDYFKLPNRTCSLTHLSPSTPRTPIRRTRGEKLPFPSWTSSPHVSDGGYDSLDYVDDIFIAISTQRKALLKLRKSEIDHYPPPLPLSGLATVNGVMEKAFGMMSRQVEKFWVLNEEVQEMVDALREELGWKGGEEDRVVVGMHIRLGDKCSETGSVKYSPLRFATPSQRSSLLGSSASQRANTCASQSASGGLDTYHADLFLTAAESASQVLSSERWREGGLKKPLLAVMSDDKGALGKLRKGTGERTEMFESLMLREVAERTERANGGSGGEDMKELENGFKAGKFHEVNTSSKHFRKTQMRIYTDQGRAGVRWSEQV